VPFEDEWWAFSSILSLGEYVEVLGPPEMRRRVAGAIRAAAEQYDDVDGPTRST
jgi:predicted DNA-binding transcriptional regulator YafY